MTTQNQLKTSPHLNGRHQHTYEAIFRHPAAHNLEWHDVRSLLDALGEVVEGSNGAFHVKRNGQMVTLHAPKHKDVATVEDLMAIRHFLEKSGDAVTAPPVAPGTHLLVVIDHHEAKIYRTELEGAIPQQLVPYDPHGFRQHLHSDNEMTDGKRARERKSFYEAIATTLRGADQILIFGSGTGESNAMEQFLTDLRHNHSDVAKHIVGSVVIDGHHQTEGQLLAKAREFFAAKAV
ncbi:MAG TPA: hypothetical protein VG122_06420 [Gemmata sp.]|jgi:hypothetical protein|nr:hypothetical protein [Gemmata sp.]